MPGHDDWCACEASSDIKVSGFVFRFCLPGSSAWVLLPDAGRLGLGLTLTLDCGSGQAKTSRRGEVPALRDHRKFAAQLCNLATSAGGLRVACEASGRRRSVSASTSPTHSVTGSHFKATLSPGFYTVLYERLVRV